MSARVTQNPQRMLDIPRQVIYPEKSDYRSVLILGEFINGRLDSMALSDLIWNFADGVSQKLDRPLF